MSNTNEQKVLRITVTPRGFHVEAIIPILGTRRSLASRVFTKQFPLTAVARTIGRDDYRVEVTRG